VIKDLVVSSIRYRRFREGIAIKNRTINGARVHNSSVVCLSMLLVLCVLVVRMFMVI